jgi:predicted DNA-binding protein
MSPRTGRPTDDKKDRGYRLRVSDADLEKLDYCAKVLGLPKAEVIRRGIDKMYEEAQKKSE